MTVEELAGKRYGGEFVFMFGYLEGRTRFVFECFDPRPDHESVQGFLTSKNRFLTREEASELVRNNNQEMVVDRNAIREQLYSEDLY